MTDFFKAWCHEAFYYLKDFGFVEEPQLKNKLANPYQVIYSNSTIKIQISGEGYGSTVSVYFIAPNHEQVHYSQFGSESNPTSRSKKKESLSQKDQVFKIAEYIHNNYQDILLGKYSSLSKEAERIANNRIKMRKQFEEFENDTDAQAERAARVAASEAGQVYKNKEYQKFIDILEPHYKYLSDKQKERLTYAKGHRFMQTDETQKK